MTAIYWTGVVSARQLVFATATARRGRDGRHWVPAARSFGKTRHKPGANARLRCVSIVAGRGCETEGSIRRVAARGGARSATCVDGRSRCCCSWSSKRGHAQHLCPWIQRTSRRTAGEAPRGAHKERLRTDYDYICRPEDGSRPRDQRIAWRSRPPLAPRALRSLKLVPEERKNAGHRQAWTPDGDNAQLRHVHQVGKSRLRSLVAPGGTRAKLDDTACLFLTALATGSQAAEARR